MINSDTRIDEALLLRYFEGEVTLSEKDEIEKWIISSEANKKLAKQIYYLSFATKTMDTLKRTDARAALKEVRGRIRRERQLQWGRWAQRAAAILAIPLLLSTLYLYYNADRQDEMSFIEVRTNLGMITTIVLPDSSRVWLNSESYLKYPVRFAKNERNVILQGEGYFSVRKNVDSRFTVQTPHHTQIQVLGTEFNVEAYEKEDEVNTTWYLEKYSSNMIQKEEKNEWICCLVRRLPIILYQGRFLFHGRLFCRIFLGKRVRLYFIKLLLKKRYVC